MMTEQVLLKLMSSVYYTYYREWTSPTPLLTQSVLLQGYSLFSAVGQKDQFVIQRKWKETLGYKVIITLAGSAVNRV